MLYDVCCGDLTYQGTYHHGQIDATQLNHGYGISVKYSVNKVVVVISKAKNWKNYFRWRFSLERIKFHVNLRKGKISFDNKMQVSSSLEVRKLWQCTLFNGPVFGGDEDS